MSWKNTAVRFFPSNAEWDVMRTVTAKPLTAAEIQAKSSVMGHSVPALITRCQAKNLLRAVDTSRKSGRLAKVFGLTAYGEQLVRVVQQFSKKRNSP